FRETGRRWNALSSTRWQIICGFLRRSDPRNPQGTPCALGDWHRLRKSRSTCSPALARSNALANYLLVPDILRLRRPLRLRLAEAIRKNVRYTIAFAQAYRGLARLAREFPR